MWASLNFRIACACLLLVLSSASLSQTDSGNDSAALDLKTAMARTLENNPALVAFGYQMRAQQGQLQQAGLRPNPELGLLVENALGSGDLQGIDSAETTLSLGWVLERGKRERRVDAARAGVSLLDAEADIQRLDAAADTARVFLNTLALQERLRLTGDAVRLAEQTTASVKRRVEAGRTPSADLARAEAELARIRLDRDNIEHEMRTSRQYLAAQWGETRPDFNRVTGNIKQLPVPDSYEQLIARLEQNPNLSRYVSERRLREAELRLAEAQAKPDWRLTAGVRRLGRSDDQAFVAGITIPLATRNRNQGRIAEARSRLVMTDADKMATRVQIETQLFALYEELQHSLHRAATLSEEILPRIETALADTERAYAAGRYSYFELKVVQAELLDARAALVESSIDAHRRIIDIERMTGTPVTSSIALQ
ncbi:MAG: TolC family protein [Gammaproteobacteria bacterium]|nr:TolC family protein [Gammaproteobacteria bacterium]NNL50354.1 TolC family protein [Woeseiaceae bacterium]